MEPNTKIALRDGSKEAAVRRRRRVDSTVPLASLRASSGIILPVFVALFLFSVPAEAQCAMCRAVLESEESGAAAEGINNGIVYLMAIPYILVAGLFYFIYRRMRS